jgi:hypothetical protein
MIDFNLTLNHAKENLDINQTIQFSINSLDEYDNAKEQIIQTINKTYNQNHDQYNWIINKEDELSFFLNEAGSNARLHGNKLKQITLILATNSYIIEFEQNKTFNPQNVANYNLKKNRGAGFKFYKSCKATIFFNNKTNANKIYFKQKIKN